jgi:flagellar FliJ protein
VAGFNFHLEPVLRHRAEKATSAEQALALAHHEYRKRLTLLADTRQRLEEALETDPEDADVFERAYSSTYRAFLNTKIDAQEDEAKLAQKTVERKRHVAVKARQERQVMEKLKDRHYLYFQQEEAQREQKEVDELALYAYQLRNAR